MADHKKFLIYLQKQSRAAAADLDQRMAAVPQVCAKGCDACCHQMVSVHTWEEEGICRYIEHDMHAATRAQVRRQVVEWWRYLKSFLRSASRADPITLPEVKALTQRMIDERVMCPFLVDHQCSIYSVRPAMCRAHVVDSDPQQCLSDPGRLGHVDGRTHMSATFGPASPHLNADLYPHAFKPLPFLVTGVLRVPVPSTPMIGIMWGDLKGLQ